MCLTDSPLCELVEGFLTQDLDIWRFRLVGWSIELDIAEEKRKFGMFCLCLRGGKGKEKAIKAGFCYCGSNS